MPISGSQCVVEVQSVHRRALQLEHFHFEIDADDRSLSYE